MVRKTPISGRFAKWLLAGAVAVGATGAVLASSASAGAVLPREATSDVWANSTDTYRIAFEAGDAARVVIRGDGDTVLHAYVYDENGNRIASDTDGDGTGVILLEWTPQWTGSFKIRVVNTGGVYNHYHLETN